MSEPSIPFANVRFAKSCRSDIAEQFEVLPQAPEARNRSANDLGIAA